MLTPKPDERERPKGSQRRRDRREGEKEIDVELPSPSPISAVPSSLRSLRSLGLSISPSGLKIRIGGLKKIWKKRYEEKLKLS